MTKDQIAVLLRLLNAYWPGEWDEDRCMVWTEVFHRLDYAVALAAMKDLGHSERFPTVSRYVELAEAQQTLANTGPYFAPGSGFILPWKRPELEGPEYRPTREEIRALRERTN